MERSDASAVRAWKEVTPRRSEVHAAGVVAGSLLAVLVLAVPGPRRHPAGRKRPAHLLELRACRHLLGVDRRLDAVEETLEPADQLGLRDAQLGLRRGVL